jgi:hypothetical protein
MRMMRPVMAICAICATMLAMTGIVRARKRRRGMMKRSRHG